MDSRISSGPGGQPRPGHPVGDQPPRDQTMQLGVFAEELTTPTRRLTKPEPRLVKPEPKAVRPDPQLIKPDPRVARLEPHATAPTQQFGQARIPSPIPSPFRGP